MKQEDLLEQRLKEFYDRVPDVEDALPFKDYLIKHEDSRMAWYLLGKQYEAKGQDAKANYCYRHAGEIYEAFESKPIPPEAPPIAHINKRRRKGLAWAAAVVLLAAGITIPAWKAIAPGGGEESLPSQAAAEASVGPAATTAGGQDAPSPSASPSAPGIISAASAPNGDGPAAVGELLTKGNKRSPLLLVKSVPVGDWHDWLMSGLPLASVGRGDKPGTATINWFDPVWCTCVPADAGNLRQKIADWKPVQEEKLLLANAIRQYRERYGKLPESPKELAGDYPSNHMAGWAESMTAWFTQLTNPQASKDHLKYPEPNWPTADEQTDAVPAGVWGDLLDQPLEIVVDKKNHRLGVVSGKILLRNYAVGLGGTKTPEGSFVISEKVKNPNGRTDGPFGSRGMTLSDTRYGIHGTDEPDSIGKDESLGCIRMSKADLEELYDLVPMGTKVTIIEEGLPQETRVPPKRFRLPSTQNETNPHKVYDWLN